MRQLEIFLEAARTGNFRDASKALGISAAAIGQTIADVEHSLGENVRLFDRGRSGSELTDAGRMLLAHGERILSEEAAVRRDIANPFAAKGRVTSVKVAYEPLIAGIVSNAAFAVLNSDPSFSRRIEASEADHELVIKKVASGDVDLGLSWLGAKQSDAIDIYPIASSPLVFIASATSHYYDPKHPDHPHGLPGMIGENFALPSRRATSPVQVRLREAIDEYFAEHKFKHRVRFEGNTTASVFAMVRTGLLLTLNYTIALHEELNVLPKIPAHSALRAFHVDPPPNRELTLVAMLRKGERPSLGAYDFTRALLLTNGLEALGALPEAEAAKAIPARKE